MWSGSTTNEVLTACFRRYEAGRFSCRIDFDRTRRSWRITLRLCSSVILRPPQTATSPRISRLMALAIRFKQLIRDGTVHDQADLARLAHISRARVTQIMDLLLLAPEIQEEILFLSPVERGKDLITERHLRRITRESSWLSQKGIWRDVTKLSS